MILALNKGFISATDRSPPNNLSFLIQVAGKILIAKYNKTFSTDSNFRKISCPALVLSAPEV